MNITVPGKVAVVTGGASGIGLAVSETLAGAGAAVVIADMDQAAGEAAVAKITGQGGRASQFVVNVRQSDEVRQLMETTKERYGSIDILVNNAGLQYLAPIIDYPEDKWDTLIGVMITGTFLCTKYAMPAMMERKWGRVVNIGSIHSKISSPFKSAYTAAKFGISGFTRGVALEGAPYGITCNCVCPSYAYTPLVQKQIASQSEMHGIPEDEVVQKIMLADAPIKHILDPSEIAGLILFLSSDAAASITGTDVVIDCGWTAH